VDGGFGDVDGHGPEVVVDDHQFGEMLCVDVAVAFVDA
jgi:hypothetical protein